MKDRARKIQEPPSPHGTSGRVRALAARGAVLLLAASALGACSLTVPMGAAVGDPTPTGSIKPQGHPSPFSPQMDAEDWRRAKSALDTALDPQGNGASVAWDNPSSGAKGSFVPLAQVYPKGDGICRAFAARVGIKGEPEKVLHASACRVNSGEWVVGRMTSVAQKKEAVPKKSDNLAERDKGTQLR